MSPIALWPPLVGLTILIVGLVVARREIGNGNGADRLLATASAFFAAPLAVFGTQHLIVAQFVMLMVPAWMPFRLFWAYFVGVALIAAAVSIVTRKQVWLSAPLQAGMIFLFVVMIHVPNAVKTPESRLFWTLAFREMAFASGAVLLAAIGARKQAGNVAAVWVTIARFVLAVTLIFFGVEHFLHPEFAPGVPLEKITPAWVPVARLWGYLVGTILLGSGAAMLTKRWAREAAVVAGAIMLVITAVLYMPLHLMATGTAAQVEGVNYVGDTLLFGAAILLLAKALPVRGAVTADFQI